MNLEDDELDLPVEVDNEDDEAEPIPRDNDEFQEYIVDYQDEYQRAIHQMRMWRRAQNLSPLDKLKKAICSDRNWEVDVLNKSTWKRYKSLEEGHGIDEAEVDNLLEQLRGEANYILHGKCTSSSEGRHSTSNKAMPSGSNNLNWEELQKVVSYIEAQLSFDEIVVDGLDEKGLGVWVADNVVPSELREVLESHLDAIAAAPNKDFLPNNQDQIQNLINPSLFPFIGSVSPIIGFPYHMDDEDDEERPVIIWKGDDHFYQWLPAEFMVHEDGLVTIETYINNLEVEGQEDLYRGIQLLFQIFVPLFEKLTVDNVELELYGRRLQVIVKAVNYIIPPKGHYEGLWHLEGMYQENIVASGVYYYFTSPFLNNSGLNFRRERLEGEDNVGSDGYNGNVEDEMGNEVPSVEGLKMSIELGTVPTSQDRVIVFTNRLQNKVAGITNDSEDQVGICKTLVFFLVDPDMEVISTRHVPAQQWEPVMHQIVHTMSLVVKRVTGKSFPLALIEEIVSRNKTGMTMKEARRVGLEVTRERDYKVEDDNQDWERPYTSHQE